MALLLTTTISCYQLLEVFLRIEKSLNLTTQQKIELVQELKKHFKTCPLVIKK
jgi:hypothetical protein